MIALAQLARITRTVAILLVTSACASVPLHAQAHPGGTGATVTDPSAGPPPLFANTAPADPSQVHMLHAMAKERNTIRQKEIIDDTNQLLDLAKQLKDAVDKSSKDQLSLSVVDTATEIEKLAKTVKEKMRDGQ